MVEYQRIIHYFSVVCKLSSDRQRCPRIPDIKTGLQSNPLYFGASGGGTVVATFLTTTPDDMGAGKRGIVMKPVWMGIVFFIVYGVFSMKTQAAEGVFAAHIETWESGYGWKSSCLGE